MKFNFIRFIIILFVFGGSITMSLCVPRFGKLNEVSIASVKPAGWIKDYLENQRNGLTGHIDAAGYPFNTKGWASDKLADVPAEHAWGGYEQTGYWTDGAVRCAYLLNDPWLREKAEETIRYVLENVDTSGYMGPKIIIAPRTWNRWTHAVFFRSIMAYYEMHQEKNIIENMTNFFLTDETDYADYRAVCCIESMLWLYSINGDKRLLGKAVETYNRFNREHWDYQSSISFMQSNKQSDEHGVSHNEMCKIATIMYIYTGEKSYLDAVENEYKKIDKNSMLIDGVLSSTEGIKGKDSLDSHETCDIADYTWSIGYLLMATGNAKYADKIERAIFNAAPGAVRSDFKGLQYFSCPNQVIADNQSNHNLMFRGGTWMSYRPCPGTECCTGDVNRIMPNFAARMWMLDNNGGITAALYGPSNIKYGDVIISEITNYPFDENIKFVINTEETSRFVFNIRIPIWCKKASLTINGEKQNMKLTAGTFVSLERVYKDNDTIVLNLPMEIKLSHWPDNGVGIERGPLVYSLAIDEKWEIDKSDPRFNAEFPAWSLHAASDWNYTLALDEKDFINKIKVIKDSFSQHPWTQETVPIALMVPAKKVPGWVLDKKKVIRSLWPVSGVEGLPEIDREGDFTFTPALPSIDKRSAIKNEKTEMVKLIPYGAAKLRITIFPDYRYDYSISEDAGSKDKKLDTSIPYGDFLNN